MFLGSSETFGKFIAKPYTAILQRQTGLTCVNFSAHNAGLGFFLHNAGILQVANGAEVCVITVTGAHNMSNRFYKVHPLRRPVSAAHKTVVVSVPERRFLGH